MSEYCLYMFIQETQTVSLCVEQLSHNLNHYSSFPEMVACFNQVFFNGLIKPSDRRPYWSLSRGFILIAWESFPSFSESPSILRDPGTFFAQYFSARVDFPSPPLSSYYLPLGLWGWPLLGSKTVHICQRAGKFFSKLMQTWRFASVSVRHISLAIILTKKVYVLPERLPDYPAVNGVGKLLNIVSRGV